MRGLLPKQTIFATSNDPLAWANSEQKHAKEQSAFSEMRDLKFAQSPCHLPLLGVTRWRRQWHPTTVLLPGKSHG